MAMDVKEARDLLTGIALVTVEVQLVGASCRLDMLVVFNCIHPSRQSTSLFGIRPLAVWFHDPFQPDYPWRSLDIDKIHLRAHEKWSLGMCRFQQLVD